MYRRKKLRRRYSLVALDPETKEEHVFPFIDGVDLKGYEKHLLVHIDYFVINELQVQDKEGLKERLKEYYQSIIIYLSKNDQPRKIKEIQKKYRKKIQELDQLSVQSGFKISYKSDKKTKYLPMNFNPTELMQYFMEIFNDFYREFDDQTEAVERNVSQNPVYQRYKEEFLQALEYNEKFREFLMKNATINPFLKEHMNNYAMYQYRKKKKDVIRENDLNFYYASQKILEQQLLTYKNIRNLTVQIKLYNEIYHDTLLDSLNQNLRQFFTTIERENQNHNVDLEEYYKTHDLDDLEKGKHL